MDSAPKIQWIRGKITFESAGGIDIDSVWQECRNQYDLTLANATNILFSPDTQFAPCRYSKDGISDWWILPPCRKDQEIDTGLWHRFFVLYFLFNNSNFELETDDDLIWRIARDYCKIKVKRPHTFFSFVKNGIEDVFKTMRLIKNVTKYALKIIALKIIIPRKNAELNALVLIRTLYPANGNIINGIYVDRHFGGDLLGDLRNKFGINALYLLYLKKYNRGQNFWSIEALKLFRKKDVVLVEGYLTAADVFRTFVHVLKRAFVNKFACQLPKFEMQNRDVSEIFKKSIFDGYTDSVFEYRMHALSLRNFLNRARVSNNVDLITYGEFFGGSRSIYQICDQIGKIKTIAFQHSYNSSRYGPVVQPREFFSGESEYCSPMPDLFITQGPQYTNILKSFYPVDRIRELGSLKIAYRLGNVLTSSGEFEQARYLGRKKICLVCPSSNDSKLLQNVFEGLSAFDDWYFLVLGHPSDREMARPIIECIRRTNFAEQIVISDVLILMDKVDLIICGYSSVAIEGLLFGVSACRVLEKGSDRLFDPDPHISEIYSQRQLSRFLESFPSVGVKPSSDSVMRSKFYFKSLDIDSILTGFKNELYVSQIN